MCATASVNQTSNIFHFLCPEFLKYVGVSTYSICKLVLTCLPVVLEGLFIIQCYFLKHHSHDKRFLKFQELFLYNSFIFSGNKAMIM